MKQMSKDWTLQKIRERQKAGNHVDDRLVKAVKESEALFLLTLEDENSFLSLIWQEIDDTRLLTPPGESRTLRDIVHRMIDQSLTLEDLTSDLGKPEHSHKPEWFKKCLVINSDFDFNHFGWIAVVPAIDSERTQSPTGSFYIYDGVHKTLVLSKRLLSGETQFQPVEALLLLPRPN